MKVEQANSRSETRNRLCTQCRGGDASTLKNSLAAVRKSSWLLLFIGCFSINFSDSAFADGLSQYKDFISDSPLIKKMAFAQSGNLYVREDDDGKRTITKGFVSFEASQQSNSWYVQITTNSPDGESNPGYGDGWVIGKSYQDYWGVTADKKLITTTPITGDAKGNVIIIAGRWQLKIEMIRKLGLIYLVAGEIPEVPQSIEWTGNLSFEAETKAQGVMSGNIVDLTNGLPKKVQFAFSKLPNTTFFVIYEYENSRAFPPCSIKGYRTTKKGTEQLWEFLLPEIEIGGFGPDFDGFSPTNFMSAGQITNATRSIRNGDKVTYITPDGKVTQPKPAVPNYNALVSNKIPLNQVGLARLVILSVMGLPLLAFVYIWFKTQKRKNTVKK